MTDPKRLSKEREAEIREEGTANEFILHDMKEELLAEIDALRAEIDRLWEISKEHISQHACRIAELEAEVNYLHDEVAIARERLGPAGYRIIQDYQGLVKRAERMEAALRLWVDPAITSMGCACQWWPETKTWSYCDGHKITQAALTDKFTDKDVDKFLEENSDLMDDLSDDKTEGNV